MPNDPRPAPSLAPDEQAVFAAALARLAAPAFVVWEDGGVALGNAAGCALRIVDPERVAAELRRSLAGPLGAYAVVRVTAPDAPAHYLAVRRAASDAEARLAAAGRRWRLTPRQLEVLGRVARGRANREIAGELGCAEATAEVHVTALLEKSRCGSRAELIARFWTEPC